MMWQALMRNPFFLRSWWVAMREQRARPLRTLGLWAVPIVLVPLAISLLLVLAWGASGDPDLVSATSLAFGVGVLALLLSGYAIGMTTSSYHRERDLGALSVVSLTATPAESEVWGRWAGALAFAFKGWVAGWILIAFGVVCALAEPHTPTDLPLRLIFLWLLTGLWCAALGAIGLYCSARSRNVTAAVTGTITMVIGLPAAYAIAAGFIIFYCNVSPKLLGWTTYLPPHPGAFFALFWSDLPVTSMAILAVTWTAFILLMLHLTARSVRDGIPLRVAAQAPPAPGPTGLVLAGTGMAVRPAPLAFPVAHAVAPVAARVPQIQRRFDPSASQKPRTLMDHLLRPFRHNPFYVAYRRGFTRLYAGIAAAPGSALPPGLMICGLLGYCLSFHSEMTGSGADATYSGVVLLVAVALAALVSFIEGASLGSRALAAERDQSTWPLLLVTGVTPARVLSGKLAACFYALSGEWTWTMPLWAIAFFAGSPVGVLALVGVPAAASAVGILCGLWMASQPRFLVINLPKVFIALGGVFMFCYVTRGLWSLEALGAVANPFVTTWEMAAHTDPAVVLPAFGAWLFQLAVGAGLVVLVYHSAERRLAHLMRGE